MTYLPEDCAIVTRAIGDYMIEHELPRFEVLEFDKHKGLLISVAPPHFTKWRVALPVGTPKRITTSHQQTLISRGSIDGVPVQLGTTAWIGRGESLEGVA